MSKPIYLLFYQAQPKEEIRWRIGEVLMTSDGLRTRLTSFGFKTEAEALVKIAELRKGRSVK